MSDDDFDTLLGFLLLIFITIFLFTYILMNIIEDYSIQEADEFKSNETVIENQQYSVPEDY